ncbi:MAG: ATP-binding protein [Gammaproteobacteria bacterium]|jgi:signal transduction histidine kinase
MIDTQLIGNLLVIGILVYASITHGMVFYRLRSQRVHGIFCLLCICVAAYAATNVIALYLVHDLESYVTTSKLSTIFVIFTVVTLAWFASHYLESNNNLPIKLIILALAPFFLINLFMSNGILWSNIDGIELTDRPFGGKVVHPVNAVISWPMYGLWAVVAVVYLLILNAVFQSLRRKIRRRGIFLLGGIIALTAGLIFDTLIDMGINKSYFYVSEYLILGFAVLMGLRLSDQLRLHEQNLENLVSARTMELEQANKELDSFSYSVSHDLQGPLRIIQGFVKVLQEDHAISTDTEAKNLILRIDAKVKHMQALMEGILQLSQVSRGELNRKFVDTSQIATAIVAELREQDPDHSVDVSIEHSLTTNGDPALIRIALQNLIGNAWKYSHDVNQPRIHLYHYTSETGQRGFALADNGVGFDPKYADKLFTPFQRLHSESEFPGTGIGLGTVDRIIRRHGGWIWADSKVGEGATFYFSFEPAADQATTNQP